MVCFSSPKGKAVNILASLSSGIWAVWPNRKNAVLGQELKGVVTQLSVLPHHSAHGGTI